MLLLRFIPDRDLQDASETPRRSSPAKKARPERRCISCRVRSGAWSVRPCKAKPGQANILRPLVSSLRRKTLSHRVLLRASTQGGASFFQPFQPRPQVCQNPLQILQGILNWNSLAHSIPQELRGPPATDTSA